MARSTVQVVVVPRNAVEELRDVVGAAPSTLPMAEEWELLLDEVRDLRAAAARAGYYDEERR